jgi:hypothetical protein
MLGGSLLVWPSGQVSGDWVWLSFIDRRSVRPLDEWYGADVTGC